MAISALRPVDRDACRAALRRGTERTTKWRDEHRQHRHNRYARSPPPAVEGDLFHLASSPNSPRSALPLPASTSTPCRFQQPCPWGSFSTTTLPAKDLQTK